MDDSIKQDWDLVAPYRQSFAYDDTEKVLQRLFINIFTELFKDQIEDIHHYGMPHLGSAKVVERFTKQDGLVVLRRPTSSDLIMRVIYENWRSLASRRGLAFLEFVLQMVWGDQWTIQRLYHSKARADRYPSLVTPMPTRDSFLTSRIMIVLDQDVDASEVLELAPIISKLVPANIVANVSVGIELEGMNDLAIGAAYVPNFIGDFQHFEPLESMRIEWTEWAVRSNFILILDVVRYSGSKTDLVTIYNGTADINLRDIGLSVMVKPEYNQLDAVFNAVLGIHPKATAHEVVAASQLVKASILPEALDDIAAAAIIQNRIISSNNGDYIGNAYVPALFRKLHWIFIEGTFYNIIAADEKLRMPDKYTVGISVSYHSHLDGAQQHIEQLMADNEDWATAVLQELVVKGSDGQTVRFLQNYTVIIIPPFQDWQLNPAVTVTEAMAHYTAYNTNGHEYHDSYADLDLTEAIVRSLHDSDMQQWQAVKDAIGQLIGAVDWVLDPANNQIVYTKPVGLNDPSLQYLYQTTLGSKLYASLDSACTDAVSIVNQDTRFSYVLTGITSSQCRFTQTNLTTGAVNTNTGVVHTRAKNPAYDPNANAEQEKKTLPLDVIAQKVISNSSSSNQAISLLAETYIETVANSIFSADVTKQFVKIEDVNSQFELNKTLRVEDPEVVYDPTPMTYEFTVIKSDNPDFIGIDTTKNIPVEPQKLVSMFVDLRIMAAENNDAQLLQNLNNAVKCAYMKDPNILGSNTLYSATLVNVPFNYIVNQIFAYMGNVESIHYPSAREYLSKLAQSIYLPNSNDQLIKLADLIPQFENTKIQKRLF